jgi:hypothetical protein
MPRGSINGEMGTGSMSGASRFEVKYLFDASNTLPCAVEIVVGAQDSSDASGTFRLNIPYISCALVIALLNVGDP